eukprot:gene22984-35212_t
MSNDVCITGLEALDVEELKMLVEKFFYAGNTAQELTQEEFRDAFHSVVKNKARLDDEEIEKLFLHIDVNASGSVDWYELADYFAALTESDLTCTGKGTGNRFIHKCSRSKLDQKEWHHRGMITKIVPHPTLDRYYTAADDGTVKAWSASTLDHVATVHNGSVSCTDICFLPKSEVLAVASRDNLVTLYNSNTNRPRLSLKGKHRVVKTMTDEASAKVDVTIRRQLRVAEGTALPTFVPDEPAAGALADGQSSSVGRRKEAKGKETTLLQRMWAASKAYEQFDVAVVPAMTSVCTGLGHYRCSDDGAYSGKEILLLGLENGQVLSFDDILQDSDDTSSGVAATEVAGLKGASKLIAASCAKNGQRNVLQPRNTWGFHRKATTVISPMQDKECVFTASMDSDVHVVQIEKGVKLKTLHGSGQPASRFSGLNAERHARGVTQVDYSPDLKLLVTVGFERHCLVWNPFVSTPLASLSGHMGRLVAARFNEKDYQIVTLCSDKITRIWDVRTYRVIQQERDPTTGVLPAKSSSSRFNRLNVTSSTPGAMIFDAKRNVVVTGTVSLQVRPMASAAGKAEASEAKAQVHFLVYSASFGQIITGNPGSVAVWTVAPVKALQLTFPVPGGVAGMCLDLEERRLIVANRDHGTLQCWNFGNGQLLRTFAPPRGAVVDAGYNDAGVVFASLARPDSSSKTMRLVIAAGTKSARVYRDTEPSNDCWISVSLAAINGATAVQCAQSHSVIVFGSATGHVATLSLDTIVAYPKCRVIVPSRVLTEHVSLGLRPLHPPVADFIVEAELSLLPTADNLPPDPSTALGSGKPAVDSPKRAQSGGKPPHGSSPGEDPASPGRATRRLGRGLSRIERSMQGLGKRIEAMVGLPWAKHFWVTAEGHGLVRLWDLKHHELLLVWKSVFGDDEAIYAMAACPVHRTLIIGDEAGYLSVYDLSGVVEGAAVAAGDIRKIRCFRCCAGGVAALSVLPPGPGKGGECPPCFSTDFEGCYYANWIRKPTVCLVASAAAVFVINTEGFLLQV